MIDSCGTHGIVIDSCGTRGIVIDSCGTSGYKGVLATLRTDLHILVRELGEPSDNRAVEKLSKFSPEDKSCLEYCRQILPRLCRQILLKYFFHL